MSPTAANEVTVTFDPDNCFFTSDLASEVNIGNEAARAWLSRNADRIPAPLFTLTMFNRRQRLKVWSVVDGAEIIRLYRESKQ